MRRKRDCRMELAGSARRKSSYLRGRGGAIWFPCWVYPVTVRSHRQRADHVSLRVVYRGGAECSTLDSAFPFISRHPREMMGQQLLENKLHWCTHTQIWMKQWGCNIRKFFFFFFCSSIQYILTVISETKLKIRAKNCQLLLDLSMIESFTPPVLSHLGHFEI